jgi:aminobenzoyl-glutamate utilization protein B
MSKDIALKWIEDNKQKIIEMSDEVWAYAEPGLLEFKTAELMADYIESQGFKVERGVAGMPSAFVATWGSGKPVLGVLGELDALAGISNKAVPYRDPVEEGGCGHGCGHNIHGVGGMAAAIAIKVAMETKNIPGTVKFYGCPAEETLVGKVFMVREGLFDGVDAVLSHHPGQLNTAGTGSSNAMNSFKVPFYGRTAHSAGDPENGISALDAVELMSNGVNFMREHVIEKARIHYIHEDCGGQPNVVPAYARTWYYVRAPERDQVEYIYNWVMDIIDGANKMARTTHRIEFLTGCYNKLPSTSLSELVVKNMREIGAPKHDAKDIEFAKKMNESINQVSKANGLRKYGVPDAEELVDEYFAEKVYDDFTAGQTGGGSTDVSDVSWVTPTMEFSTACNMLGTPGHSWQFVAQSGSSIGHKGLIFATQVIATSGIEILTDAALLKNIRDEYTKRLAGRKYKSPLPADLEPPLDQLKK